MFDHPWDQESFEWDISPEDICIDLGGFHGDWARRFLDRNPCKLHVFEPQLWVLPELRAKVPEATVYPFGLGASSREEKLFSFGTYGCSFVEGNSNETSRGEIREAGEVLRPLGPIKFMMVNIELSEYELLNHLLEIKLLPEIIVVQFHLPTREYKEPYFSTRKALAKSYRPVWDYGVVLSAWRRK
jgi:hypothetical protein